MIAYRYSYNLRVIDLENCSSVNFINCWSIVDHHWVLFLIIVWYHALIVAKRSTPGCHQKRLSSTVIIASTMRFGMMAYVVYHFVFFVSHHHILIENLINAIIPKNAITSRIAIHRSSSFLWWCIFIMVLRTGTRD